MNASAWSKVRRICDDFRAQTLAWQADHPYLRALQTQLCENRNGGSYTLETPIVYNKALDDLGPHSNPACIIVSDNPGKTEQQAGQQRYLVGQSGKLAASWLAHNLGVDFRSSVIVLNKTPLHTARTTELADLLALAGNNRQRLSALLIESQIKMAQYAFDLFAALREHKESMQFPWKDFGGPLLWVSGLGELKPKGIFEAYARAMAASLALLANADKERVLLFSHFSMNRFSIEIASKRLPGEPLPAAMLRIGSENRERVLARLG